MQLAGEENDHEYDQQTQGQGGELTYAQFCKQLLRRPGAGGHQRVLRGGCGSQVHRGNGLWLWIAGASKRRTDEGGLLRLVVRDRESGAEGIWRQPSTMAHALLPSGVPSPV